MGDNWDVPVAGTAGPDYATDDINPILTVLDTYALNPKAPVFGAMGDDLTDDTAALQAFIDAVCIPAGRHGIIPPGTYRISAALEIPFATGWSIDGLARGGVVIKQMTDNTPIVKFLGSNTHSWRISGIHFTYQNQQTVADTLAIPLYFTFEAGAGTTNYYNCEIADILFSKCFRCISTDGATQTLLWGCNFHDIWVDSSVRGSFIRLVPLAAAGQPNNSFRNMYIRPDNMDASEPIFHLRACEGTQMDSIEVNNLLNGNKVLYDGGGGTFDIGSLKIEIATFSAANQMIVDVPSSPLRIRRLLVSPLTVNVGAGNKAYIVGCSAGSGADIQIGRLDLSSMTVTSGTLFVLRGGSTAAQPHNRFRIDSFPVGHLPAGAYLTDNGSSDTNEGTTIRSWSEDRVSLDRGNADATLVAGQDAPTQLFATALTAKRTVTLPAPTGSHNLFNGFKFKIVRTGGGAFDLDVVRPGPTLLGTIPSGATGHLEFTWSRAGGSGAWLLTDKYLSTWT